MIKIKYKAPVLDGSGYGSCSRQYVKALLNQDVDLTVSPISFEQVKPDLGELGQLMNENINKNIDYNINLIHLTPEHYPMFKEPGKINVGYTVWESSKIHNDWIDYCNCMDAILVPCEWNVEVFRDSGVTVPIYCVPHIIDSTRFESKQEYNIKDTSNLDYIFYSIFQLNERKDPASLLRAYWSEFTSDDDVMLAIKTYRNGYTDQEKQAVIEVIKNIKRGVQLPKGKDFAKVHLILDILSDEALAGLHTYGDCFVSLNRAEGFGLPEAEAAATGNPVIVTGYGGVNQFLNKNNSYLINYMLIPVTGNNSLWYTSDQRWAQADICDAAKIMRHVYENKEEAKQKGLLAQKNIKNNFSPEHIGKLYVEVLEKIVNLSK